VLVCPGCQAAFDWAAELDRCAVCSSVRLVRQLGEVECRDCGAVRHSATASVPGHLASLPPAEMAERGISTESAAVGDLAHEVEQALARVLGRTAGSAAGG
jgi:hypothetical protein